MKLKRGNEDSQVSREVYEARSERDAVVGGESDESGGTFKTASADVIKARRIVKVGKKASFKVSLSKPTSPRRRDGEYVIPAPAPAAFTFGSSSGGFDFSAPAPAAFPTESTVPTPTSTTPHPINNSDHSALASSNNEALPSTTLATKETFDAPTAMVEGTHPSHSESTTLAAKETFDAPTAVEEGTHPSHPEAASTACTEE